MTGSRGVSATAAGVLIVVLAALVLLRGLGATPAATGSSTPGAAVGTTPSASPIASAPTVPTAAAPATLRGQWANPKYGYIVVLPEPYHVSARLTREFASQHPAARDAFTVLTPAEEDAASQGEDCEVGCRALNHAAVVLIYTDAGSMTPRQWHQAGNTPGSPGTLTDLTIGGRPALKIEPSGKYEVMYVVADGKGRMFHLAYELFHIANPPAGASRDKLDQIIASFRFI
ncbi:MAG: hypothetical protein ABJB39_05650 [Chloroflexota bacterium]